MTEKELLRNYVAEVKQLRQRARDFNLSDKEIDELVLNCFNSLDKEIPPKRNYGRLFKFATIIFGAALFCYVLLYVHQPTSSIVLRNVQGLIYPGLKFVRFLSMPVIKYFPSLTELYDESCLVENPYFYVQNMECWPCENVYSVINLTGFDNFTLYESGTPFIIKTDQRLILPEDIRKLYRKNAAIFDSDANRILSTHRNFTEIKDLKFMNESSDIHISWRINRILPARLLRKLFRGPKILSEWSGQSIERYLMIDGSEADPYVLPSFECSYVFLVQGSGVRTIALKPAKECSRTCKTISVTLHPGYLLSYNWWYWKPISLPAENGTVSVSYISSYC